MDLTSLLGTLVSQDSLTQIGSTAGVSAKDVQSVLASALPSLLGGAQQQAASQSTAQSFSGALEQHAASDTSNLTSFLSGVDLDDGAKILGHLLGSNSTTVVNQASQASGISAASTLKVLAAAAPLLMSLMGKTAQTQQSTSSASGSVGLGGVVGSLLKNVDVGKLLLSLLK